MKTAMLLFSCNLIDQIAFIKREVSVKSLDLAIRRLPHLHLVK